jgi:hypothetical protein
MTNPINRISPPGVYSDLMEPTSRHCCDDSSQFPKDLRSILRWEHFGFKPYAFLAEAIPWVGFKIDEADLNEIDFRPT